MELSEAIKILKHHNKWRRSKEDFNPFTMVNPKQLGVAIDTVVNQYQSK